MKKQDNANIKAEKSKVKSIIDVNLPGISANPDIDPGAEMVENTILKIEQMFQAGEEEIHVNLYRQSKLKDWEFLDEITDLGPGLLKNIQQRHGGGKYHVRVFDHEGNFIGLGGGKSSFTIAGQPRDQIQEVQQQPRIQEGDQELKFLEKMKLYRDLFKGENGGSSGGEHMKELMDIQSMMIKQSRSFIEDQLSILKDRPSGSETNVNDIILSAIENLPLLLSKGLIPGMAAPAPVPALPGPGSAPGSSEEKKIENLDNARKVLYNIQQKERLTMIQQILLNIISKDSISSADIDLLWNLIQQFAPQLIQQFQALPIDQMRALVVGAFIPNPTSKQGSNIDALITAFKLRTNPKEVVITPPVIPAA